jgi:hypothetical protein
MIDPVAGRVGPNNGVGKTRQLLFQSEIGRHDGNRKGWETGARRSLASRVLFMFGNAKHAKSVFSSEAERVAHVT